MGEAVTKSTLWGRGKICANYWPSETINAGFLQAYFNLDSLHLASALWEHVRLGVDESL